MRNEPNNFQATPDFESIKQTSPYGAEYWSARDLAPLLGYASSWQNFETAIKRAKTACQQTGNPTKHHFNDTIKMINLGKGAQRKVKDYSLSRLACYLIAQNGDPRKPEIAAAQTYFAVATRENELQQLREEQQQRVELRERITENNKDLAAAAHNAGVLSRFFGLFQSAGYEGLYNGLSPEELKTRKGVPAKEDILDRMGSSELAANDFRVTQTRDKLRKEGIIGQTNAINTHREVGRTVRKAIEEIGGTMPEELPAEPSIRPLLTERQRRARAQNKLAGSQSQDDETKPAQGKLF